MTTGTPPARTHAAIVLAAGEGKRFRSATPKVLHDLCGRPLAAYALDAIGKASPVVVVTGRDADAVEDALAAQTKRRLTFARQPTQRGTGDAVAVGLERLGGDATVLVLPGDTPLLEPATVRELLRAHRRSKAAATVLTARLDDPSGYGRIIREGKDVRAIIEHRDATAAQRAVDEVNGGVYAFESDALAAALSKVEPHNDQGEYYLTDVIAILVDAGERVRAVMVDDPDQIRGVNDRAQLAEAAAILRARTNRRLMDAGVTIVDPAQTYIDPSVKVKPDTIIHPMTFLTGATVVGSGAEVGPGTRVSDSVIGDGATVTFSVVDQARVGARATVGPYAYLRPGARLAAGSKVGTYVEVKNSIVGEGSKVPHLSYVGDAVIGKDVNVGAGTVTVNYDAETKTKSKTAIGDGAKIGSDTMLVAPVRVGKGAVTGAGSVVTKDVPPGTVVVGSPARPMRKRKARGDSA